MKEEKRILNVLGQVDEKYIEEAAPGKRANKKAKHKSPTWTKWGALAACVCLVLAVSMFGNLFAPNIVKEPGLFCMTAYALAKSDEIELYEEREMQEGVALPKEFGWSLAMNSYPGLPLKLSLPEYPNATFDVTISDGEFFLWELGKSTQNITELGSSFSVDNGTTLYWSNARYMGTEAYANVVMRDGKNIVGYAVIKIYTADIENAPAQLYQAIMLKSVSFPKVDGKYQNVTDKYVASEMESAKAE
ncbi:MAG: hypothetical protein PHR92_12820 [Lachnospiraceae bacterium]|nr:hypothetical protein [Lachnospiraceae bacterium]